MIDFNRVSDNKVQFKIDLSIFNNVVITKTLYWALGSYLVFWSSFKNDIQNITLEKKDGFISDNEFYTLRHLISQNLIDFKTRDIIHQETKNIRDILYVKAFANGDDFEDYNLINSSDV